MQSDKQQESVIHAQGNRNCLLRSPGDGHIRQKFKEDTIHMVKNLLKSLKEVKEKV